jgi:hypothetical protein
VRRAEAEAEIVRRYAETRYGGKSWGCERRVAARIEATAQGLDIRYVVTTLQGGSAEWLYDTLYCARGQTVDYYLAINVMKPRFQAAWGSLRVSAGLRTTRRGGGSMKSCDA